MAKRRRRQVQIKKVSCFFSKKQLKSLELFFNSYKEFSGGIYRLKNHNVKYIQGSLFV